MKISKIPNQIIKEPLQALNLKNVDAVALHHTAHPTADVKTVEKWHINNGWRAIGYNFFVGFDGTVYEGRGFNLGAGVENQNGHIISICFQGDYENTNLEMPSEQFNAGIDIIKYVKEKVPAVKKIAGHKDFTATACPGKNFPLEEMKRLKKRVEKMKLESANDIIWELSQMIEISDVDSAVKSLEKAKEENSSLYWILYKIVNK